MMSDGSDLGLRSTVQHTHNPIIGFNRYIVIVTLRWIAQNFVYVRVRSTRTEFVGRDMKNLKARFQSCHRCPEDVVMVHLVPWLFRRAWRLNSSIGIERIPTRCDDMPTQFMADVKAPRELNLQADCLASSSLASDEQVHPGVFCRHPNVKLTAELSVDVVPNQELTFMDCEYRFHRGASPRASNSFM